MSGAHELGGEEAEHQGDNEPDHPLIGASDVGRHRVQPLIKSRPELADLAAESGDFSAGAGDFSAGASDFFMHVLGEATLGLGDLGVDAFDLSSNHLDLGSDEFAGGEFV